MQTFPSEHSKYKTRRFATHLQQMRVECVSSVKKKKDLASYRGCTLSQRQSQQKGTSESGAHLQSAKKNELNHKMINIASTPPPLKTPKPINMLMFFFCIFIGLGGQRCLILHWESILKCLCTGDLKLPHHSRWKVAYCDVKKKKSCHYILSGGLRETFPPLAENIKLSVHINTVSILVRLSD